MDSKNLKEYKRRRFESGDFGDCWFEIKSADDNQSPKKLCSIKTILQISSPVFNELLSGISDSSKETTIAIENTDMKTFQKLLDFIQWEEIDLKEVGEAFALIELSRKYKIPDLENNCQKFLGSSCDVTNACVIFEKAKQLDITGLVEKALTVIKAQTKDVFASPALLESKISTLMEILDQDALSVESEMDVFEMVSRFATHNGLIIDSVDSTGENKDGDLSELVKKIRFMAMKPKEFALNPMRSNLLTAEQKNAIISKLLLPLETFQAFPVGFTEKIYRIHYHNTNFR